LSKYKKIDLTAYKSVAVESVRFFNSELENLNSSCIKASDILNCVSVGISTALRDCIPYANTPVLINIPVQLPGIPYAGIAMAGITWGISGSLAKTNAQAQALGTRIEAERMLTVLEGLKSIEERISEGGALLYALSGKLWKSLEALQGHDGTGERLSDEAAREIDASVRLVKSIKQVIETDICSANGFLTKESGIIFRKMLKEVKGACNV
jgi:hypothetical protein